MIRAILTLLQIAIVLICPFQCCCQTGDGATPCCRVGGCCVNEQSNLPNDDAPDLPKGKGHDCFCQGAIVVDSRVAERELDGVQGIFWLNDVTACAFHPSLAIVSLDAGHQCPPFVTGRDICAMTCTLLI